MTFMDKAYWLYKTEHPVRHAKRGSGLEEYFARQREPLSLPRGFRQEQHLTISAVGDLINNSLLANSAGTIYQEVESQIFDVDLSMANLECPIVGTKNSAFEFNSKTAPTLYYDISNFDIVKGPARAPFKFMATACNHSLDFGEEGVASTLEALKRSGIRSNGINLSEDDADKAAIFEIKNFKIGIVAFTFGLNAFKPPKSKPRIVNVMKLNSGVAANDFSQLTAQLDFCKKQGVNFVIAHLHWGLEHEFYPTPEQVELAHHIAEMGVDLIIGHHPHVIQPMECYQARRDTNRVVPIYYSLGNLINFFTASYLTESLLAKLELVSGVGADGRPAVYVSKADAIKIYQKSDIENKSVRLSLHR